LRRARRSSAPLTPARPPARPRAPQAAAVANRLEVATLLLQEAGASARALALATNRYGQSALQIAARKGCAQMMQLLATAAA
jgi:ankyrin repeat protein